MAKTTTKLMALALAGATAYGAWSVGQCLWGDDASVEGTDDVLNQVWIERMPEGPRDMIGHLVMIDVPEHRFGAAGKSSQWRHVIEGFKYALEGNRLSVFFPQDRVKAQLTVRSWKCKGEAPAPFELCLEINNGRRSAVFYSLEEWHIDPDHVDESLADLREDNPALAELLPASVPATDSDDDRDGYAEVEALPFGG